MPAFTPPTMPQGSTDPFFGRYSIPVGISVVKRGAAFQRVPFPALAEIADLEEGVEWFQGGRTYYVDSETAAQLEVDGFDIELPGYGEGAYGYGYYGG